MPAEELRELAEGDDGAESVDVEAVFRRLRHAGREIPDIDIIPGSALGNFAFQKLAMVTELDQLGDALALHDLISAIAGFLPRKEIFRNARSDEPLETVAPRPG